MRHERRAARAAEPADRVEPSLGVEPLHDLGRAARHRLDRGPAIAGGGERSDVGAGCRGDLVPRDVGRRERLADDPRVDEHDVDAVLADPVGEERVLVALRVERSDEDDCWHGSSLVQDASGSTPR